MGAATFDKLYDHYNTLSQAKDKIAQHSEEYEEAIKSTKGGEKEKKLAAQIISKFFKHFPRLQNDAVEAIFDICEDDEASIRIVGMKTLPVLCKENKEYVGKITDILSQLLQLDDPQEFNVANNALIQVLQEDPLTAVKSIFKQISESDVPVREKCLKFLVTKVKSLDKETTEVEEVMVTEFRKLLQDVSGDEFLSVITYLTTSKVAGTQSGQLELISMCAEQAELDQDFDALDKESNNADRLITCFKFALPFFSAKIESTKFVKYICDQVLPHWDEIKELSQGEMYQLAILRQLAELSTHCGKLETPSSHVVQIYDKLKLYMPPPPEDTTLTTMPFLDFSTVEALLYAFHRLARQCPDFLTHDPQELKDFRARLLYFSRGVQGCRSAIKTVDKDKNYTAEELKIQQITPIMLDNINMIIKDLFYQPPMYKCNVKLSFRTESNSTKRTPEAGPQKRHIPITFDSKNGSAPPPKHGRVNRSGDNMKLYTPPSGKFSNSFQHYDNKQRGNRFGGRGGRGGMRGRSSNRGWRN